MPLKVFLAVAAAAAIALGFMLPVPGKTAGVTSQIETISIGRG